MVAATATFAQEGGAIDTFSWSVDLPNVVVTGQFAPTDLRQAVHPVRIIQRERIEQLGANNLEQLLAQDLAIRIQQDLILGSSLQLLGLGGENVRIMVDGVPLIGALDGNIDLGQVNLHNVQRVEIVEGPMAVSYGADALAGVINLITRRQPTAKAGAEFRQQLESRGEQSSLLSFSGRTPSGWYVRAQLSRDWFGGYSEDTLRALPWNPKRQWLADAQAGKSWNNDQQLRWQSGWLWEEVENLGEVRRPQFKPYAFDDYYRTRRSQHALSHEGKLNEHWRWQATAALTLFDRTKQTLRTELAEPGGSAEVPGEQDTTRLRAWTLRPVWAWSGPGQQWQAQLGADLRLDQAQGTRLQAEQGDNWASLGDYALFGSLRYRAKRGWQAEAGLRAAYNTRFQSPLIPSLHLRWPMAPHWTLRASYAHGFRSPQLKELYFFFIDVNHYIVGNVNLRPESGRNAQLNIEGEWTPGQHKIRLQSSIFYNRIENKIDLYQFIEMADGGIIPAPADTNTFRYAYFNQALYLNHGWQHRLSWQCERVEAQLGWALIGYYNPYSNNDNNTPSYTYAGEWSVQAGVQPFRQGPWLNAFGRYNDAIISYYPEVIDGIEVVRQRQQEGFWQIDLSIRQLWQAGRIQVAGGVRNLLNIQQVAVSGGGGSAHSGGSGSAAVSLGRSFWLSLRLAPWDK
jgi:outer membrane receptor for ferrienterochelin and colicins